MKITGIGWLESGSYTTRWLVSEGFGSSSYCPTDGGIYFTRPCSDGGEAACLYFYEFATSRRREVVAIGKRIWPGLSVRRDGGAVLWAQVDHYVSDLMLVDPFGLE